MADEKKQKISTESYKGVRDFYPNEMAIHNYILDVMSRVAERFGFTASDGEACVGCAVKGRKSGKHAKTECAR